MPGVQGSQPSNLPPIVPEPSLQDITGPRQGAPLPSFGPPQPGAQQTLGQVLQPEQAPQESPEDIEKQKELNSALQDLAAYAQRLPEGKEADKQVALDELQSYLAETQGAQPEELSIKNRAFVGLGRDDTERVNALNKLFGASGGSGRMNPKTGELEFRRTKSEKFRSVEGDSGLREFFGDVADISGEAIQLGGEVTAGAVAGGLASMGGLTAPVGIAAGLVAAPAGGQIARRAAIEATGIPTSPEESEIENYALGLGAEALTLGAIKGLPAGVRTIRKFLSDVKSETQLSRIGEMKEVIQALDNVADDFGYKAASKPAQTGEAVRSLIDSEHQRLAQAVNLVDQAAIQRAGDNPVSSRNLLEKMKSVLEKEGAQLDPKTGIFKKLERPISISGETVPAEAIAGSRQTVAFGHEQGSKLLNDLINDYNFFVSQEKSIGGTTMDELLSRVRKYESAVDYTSAMPKGPQMNEALEQIVGGAIRDRNTAFQKVLTGTPEESMWKSAYSEFSKKASVIADIRSAIRNKESGELIVTALTKAKDPDRLAKLKYIIGEKSPEWQNLRANIVMNEIDKAIDPASGIFQGARFNDGLKKLGDRFLKELGNEEAINRLRLIARKADKIALADTLSPGLENSALNMAKAMTSVGGGTGSKLPIVQAIFKMFRGNKYAIDYLTDEGFMQMTKEATSKAEQKIIMEAAETMQKVKEASKVVRIGKRQVYIPVLKTLGQVQAAREGSSAAVNMLLEEEQKAAPINPQDFSTDETYGLPQ